MKNNFLKIVLLPLVALIFVACNSDSSCHEERYVAMGVKLYRTTFDADAETYVTNDFKPDSISVYGVGNDSILYEKVSLSTFNLPLRTDSAGDCVTQYVFQLAADNFDTITIQHWNTDNYLSFACGCIVFSELLDVSSTVYNIDSVVIANPSVQNVSDTHINVYYK